MDIETGTETERGADRVAGDGSGLPAQEAWQPRTDARWSASPPPYPTASSAPTLSDPVLDAVAALRQEMVGEMRAVRREFIAALGVWSPPADAAAESAAAEVRALGAELHRGLETLLDCVRDVTAAMGTSSASAASSTEPVVAAVQQARDALLDRLEAQHAATRGRLAELAALTQSGTAATRATQERLAALTEATDELRDAVEGQDAPEVLELPARLPMPYGRTGDGAAADDPDDLDDLWDEDDEDAEELDDPSARTSSAPDLDDTDRLDPVPAHDRHAPDDDLQDEVPSLAEGDLVDEVIDEPVDEVTDVEARPLPAVDLADDEDEPPSVADRARSRAAQVAPSRPSRPSWSYEPDAPSAYAATERPVPPPPRSTWAPAQDPSDDDLEDLGESPARGRWFRSRD